MKRICTLLVGLLCFGIAVADELNQAQLRLRTDIYNFLREEGYMPEIDSDGDVKFKVEGKPYYVSVNSHDTSPMYIALFRSFEYPDGYTRQTVQLAATELNLYKGVKFLCLTNSIKVQAELYLQNAEAFKYAFYKLVSQIQNVVGDLIDECDKVAGSGSSSTSTRTSSSTVSTASPGRRDADKFFPVDGLILGISTLDDARRLGGVVEDKKDGDYYCNINDHAWWDFSKNDGIFDWLYITSYEPMPDLWQRQFGFSFSLSYNEWMTLFRNLGFSIEVKKQPTTKEYSGRNTLSAKFEATSPDRSIKFVLEFDYGNDKGEGYGVNAKNSIYSIRVLSNYY